MVAQDAIAMAGRLRRRSNWRFQRPIGEAGQAQGQLPVLRHKFPRNWSPWRRHAGEDAINSAKAQYQDLANVTPSKSRTVVAPAHELPYSATIDGTPSIQAIA